VGRPVVQWLRDGLGSFRSASEVGPWPRRAGRGASSWCPPSTGLGAPHWDAYARGALLGITRAPPRPHRPPALEGIAFQVADVLSAMEADSPAPHRRAAVDGRRRRQQPLMQIQPT